MNDQLRNEIVQRWRGGQSQRGIARALSIARPTVARVITEHQIERGEIPSPPAERARPTSLLADHEQKLHELLTRYPDISITRLLQELRREGYRGGYSTLRRRVRHMRPRRRHGFAERFETAPGAQAQMDYSVYELEFTHEGRRRVNLFSYVLGYSRRQYLRFVEAQDMETTLREHIRAFEHLGGVAATCLYDNMKVVVARYEDDEPIYNTRFLAFATHYGFRPMACRPRRAQTKGKVERPFRYVETSLLGGRTFRSLEHLNEVAAWWLAEVADVRVHATTKQRPIDRHAEERPHLVALPATPYEVAEMVYRSVDAEGYISHGQNRYSVPWDKTHPGMVLPVKITEDELVIYSQQISELVRHRRFPAGVTHQSIQFREHLPPRDQVERRALLQEQFQKLGASAVEFFEGLLKTRRQPWEQAQRALGLLRIYRQSDWLAALEHANRFGAFSFSSLERILAVQAQPKSCAEHLADQTKDHLPPQLTNDPIPPRPPAKYQQLWNEGTSNEQTDSPPEMEQPKVKESDSEPPAADRDTGPGDAA